MTTTYLMAADNTIGSTLMIVGMMLALYFVMTIPQKRQQKKDSQMRASLDIGDEILTQGGILGRVVSMKEDTVVIETSSDNVRLRILRTAVIQITSQKEAPKKEAPKKDAK